MSEHIDRRTFLRILSGAFVVGAVAPFTAGCGGGNTGNPVLSSGSGSSSSTNGGGTSSSSTSSSSQSSASSTSSSSSSTSGSSTSSSSSSSSSSSGPITVTGTIENSSSTILGGYFVQISGTTFSATANSSGVFSISSVTVYGSQLLLVYTDSTKATMYGYAYVTISGSGTDSLGTITVIAAPGLPPAAPVIRRRSS